MTEKKEKYDTAPKSLNALKKKYELRGGDWKEALEKVKETTGGKDIAAAMKEGWKLEDFVKLLLDDDGGEAPEPPSQENPAQEAVDFSFTEAPASFNVKAISPAGFDIMLTLRDSDTGALMERVQGALHWLNENGYQPTGRRGGGNGGNSQPNGNQGEAPLCPTHNQPMKPSQYGGWYCPVKIAEDDGTGKPVYCKQKIKK